MSRGAERLPLVLAGALLLGCGGDPAEQPVPPTGDRPWLAVRYLVDVEVLFSDCDLGGRRFVGGGATASVLQRDGRLRWRQASTGESTGGATLELQGDLVKSGEAWFVRFSDDTNCRTAVREVGGVERRVTVRVPPVSESDAQLELCAGGVLQGQVRAQVIFDGLFDRGRCTPRPPAGEAGCGADPCCGYACCDVLMSWRAAPAEESALRPADAPDRGVVCEEEPLGEQPNAGAPPP